MKQIKKLFEQKRLLIVFFITIMFSVLSGTNICACTADSTKTVMCKQIAVHLQKMPCVETSSSKNDLALLLQVIENTNKKIINLNIIVVVYIAITNLVIIIVFPKFIFKIYENRENDHEENT